MRVVFFPIIFSLIFLLLFSGCINSPQSPTGKAPLPMGGTTSTAKTAFEKAPAPNLVESENEIFQNKLSLFSVPLNSKLSKTEIKKSFSGKTSAKTLGENSFELSRENVGGLLGLLGHQAYALTASGNFVLLSPIGFARIILIDSNDKEYLVFSSDYFFFDQGTGSFDNICIETCSFGEEAIIVKEIVVEAVDADLSLQSFFLSPFPLVGASPEEQYYARLALLQQEIADKGLHWTAGETDVSKLPYLELRQLFLNGEMPNTQGFEFYKAGVFEYRSD